MSWWSVTASTSCRPIECTGFSDVIGSWKIIAISLPRSLRSFVLPRPSRSSPLKSTWPVTVVFRLSFSPMIERQVTLLPQPDSPTMPTVRPGSMLKSTPTTAVTMPSSVWKRVRRSRTSSREVMRMLSSGSVGLSGEPDSRVDPSVEEVHDEREDDDRERTEDDDALEDREVELADRPDRGRAQPVQPEDGLDEDRPAEQQADVHAQDRDHRQERVSQD